MTLRRLLSAVVAAVMLALSASPAAAADVATIGCVREMAAPDQVTLMLDLARSTARGESNASTPPSVTQALYEGAERCAKKYGWGAAAVEAAAKYTYVALRVEAIREVAEGLGIDYGDITATLAAMTQVERDSMIKADAVGIRALVAGLRSRGVDVTNPQKADLYGRLAVLTLLMDKNRADFAAS